MGENLEGQHENAIVSSKGQVTLPAAMRAKLGIKPGSHIQFEVRGTELVIKPELPMSAYYGMLKGYDLGDTEPEKEPDRTFE
ncbi:MAG: hypothetical protein B7X59_13380 [Polaromonas sp. 39-63-203]|nr:MAG: hypothetical protein B7X59_13380 [Polaromonas sp. 39-63-203]